MCELGDEELVNLATFQREGLKWSLKKNIHKGLRILTKVGRACRLL